MNACIKLTDLCEVINSWRVDYMLVWEKTNAGKTLKFCDEDSYSEDEDENTAHTLTELKDMYGNYLVTSIDIDEGEFSITIKKP